MKGFKINTSKKMLHISEEILLISINQIKDKTAFLVSGTCPTKFEDYIFYTEELYIGDTVTVTVSEIEQSISPLIVQQEDRNVLMKKYESLKRELKAVKIL